MTFTVFLRRYGVSLSIGLAALLQTYGSNAEYYRWQNDKGETVYSDQIPPEEARKRKDALNKSGRVTKRIEGAKSKEQIELEARLAVLRKEQDKIIKKQRSDDKVLLSTYRTEEDIRVAMKRKLAILDAQQRLAEGNLQQLEIQLQNQQKIAAGHERKGNQVPKILLDDMIKTQQQITLARLEIENQRVKRKRVEKEFETDIDRYVFLTHANEGAEHVSAVSAELKAADELGLVDCESEAICAAAWRHARVFVQKYSTTPIDVDNDKLIMSSDPLSDQDMSLSVSLMERARKSNQIFLDIRCRKSYMGGELCASTKAHDIRTSFRPYIQSALGR